MISKSLIKQVATSSSDGSSRAYHRPSSATILNAKAVKAPDGTLDHITLAVKQHRLIALVQSIGGITIDQ